MPPPPGSPLRLHCPGHLHPHRSTFPPACQWGPWGLTLLPAARLAHCNTGPSHKAGAGSRTQAQGQRGGSAERMTATPLTVMLVSCLTPPPRPSTPKTHLPRAPLSRPSRGLRGSSHTPLLCGSPATLWLTPWDQRSRDSWFRLGTTLIPPAAAMLAGPETSCHQAVLGAGRTEELWEETEEGTLWPRRKGLRGSREKRPLRTATEGRTSGRATLRAGLQRVPTLVSFRDLPGPGLLPGALWEGSGVSRPQTLPAGRAQA